MHRVIHGFEDGLRIAALSLWENLFPTHTSLQIDDYVMSVAQSKSEQSVNHSRFNTWFGQSQRELNRNPDTRSYLLVKSKTDRDRAVAVTPDWARTYQRESILSLLAKLRRTFDVQSAPYVTRLSPQKRNGFTLPQIRKSRFSML